jgi:DNA sulfur modification protein DndD
MILERVALENFGAYRGRHELELAPPSPERPVILVGGLNGEGKTTLLHALQLALYGKMARVSNRGDLGYEELLRRAVHRSANAEEGAAVEVTLRHVVEGKAEALSVRRAWSRREGHTRELLEVRRDGAIDAALTERWAEHLEGLMPVRLSGLFFFDGEKIEALADLDRSAEALRTAIQVLLGLDLVDQLLADLQVLERRKRTEQKSAGEQAAIEAVKRELDRLEARRDALVAEREAAQAATRRAEHALGEAEERFALGGGEACARRKDLEAQRASSEEQLGQIEEALREEAEGAAPLLLVADLLDQIARDDEAERAMAQARELGGLLAAHEASALGAAEAAGASGRVLAALADLFETGRRRRNALESAPAYLDLSTEARASLAALRPELRAGAQHRLRRLVEHAERHASARAEAERMLARTPETDAIAGLASQRALAKEALARTEHALGAIEAELDRVVREHERGWDAYARRLTASVSEQIEGQAVARILGASERTRETMKRFRGAILERRVRRIEGMVLESFQHLTRKAALLSGLRIDPASFALTLHGADGRELSSERLSAGERQILAVAILWALARASGRALPVVIDAPLGRLDSAHRARLVERYFPHASHQVILLSTDEEIDEAHHARLSPSIGRSYLIRHEDRTCSSTLSPGYFF